MTDGWRSRAGTSFACEKRPASGSRGMVVTNHPLASAAGAEMLTAGGNAVDAAIAGFFTLSVVEPMMVGIFGGGMAHIRLADGSHRVIDGQAYAPAAATPDMYRPVSDTLPNYLDTDDDNDGAPTAAEGTADRNNNGIPDYLDDTIAATDGLPLRIYLPAIHR